MHPLKYHENQQHGSPDFPMAYYFVDRHHPRYQMPYHWHDEFEIIHVISGSFLLSNDDEQHALKQGEMAWIPSGRLHGGIPSDCVYECVVFDMRMLLKGGRAGHRIITDMLHGRLDISPLLDAPRYTLLPMFKALNARADGYELIAIGCLLQFMGELAMQHAYRRPHNPLPGEAKRLLALKHVFELIETGYSGKLTLEQLSASVSMSPKYFCRFFKQAVHRSPMSYLTYYRVERACYELAATEKNATEVALDCGFGSLNYFIRTFKTVKGLTPGQYARDIRQGEG